MADGDSSVQPPLPDDPTPPLPPQPPPPLPPPPSSSPPPSNQTSNSLTDRLDFGSDVGGLSNVEDDLPPAKRQRLHEVESRAAAEIGGVSVGEATPPPPLATSYDSLEEGELSDDLPVEVRLKSRSVPSPLAHSPSNRDVVSSNVSLSSRPAELDKLPAENTVSVADATKSSDAVLEEGRTMPAEEKTAGSASPNTEQEEGLLATIRANTGPQEFEIIDSVIGSDSEDSGESSEDDYLNDDEIDALLEKGMIDYRPSSEKLSQPIERQKIVLKERGQDPFDILPEGWVMITHNSGMPVFLHRQSRVCTLSQPYFLGSGSVRKHDIPLSAIPCLQYRRALESEAKENGSSQQSDAASDVVNGDASSTEGDSTPQCPFQKSPPPENQDSVTSVEAQGSSKSDQEDGKPGSDDATSEQSADKQDSGVTVVSSTSDLEKGETGGAQPNTTLGYTPPNSDPTVIITKPPAGKGPITKPLAGVKVESVESYKKHKTLDPVELRKYCENLFEFQTITLQKYRTWKERRKHHKKMKSIARPTLPSNTKLITCPVITKQDGNPSKKREFVLNPSGKSAISILHEYVQKAMRSQPIYVFKEMENSVTPFSVTVLINKVEYCTGYASSKKAAKNAAAKETIGILIPELAQFSDEGEKQQPHDDLSFFDQVKVEDPRVHELSTKAGLPNPFMILDECLSRNYGLGDTQCEVSMKTLERQKSEYTMKVGKHVATVVCKNKREGKQLAAQAILQKLHPHIFSWASLLRLYGSDTTAMRDKQREEFSVTSLHAKARHHQPNNAVLSKLRYEMKKLHDRQVYLLETEWSCRESLIEALNLDISSTWVSIAWRLTDTHHVTPGGGDEWNLQTTKTEPMEWEASVNMKEEKVASGEHMSCKKEVKASVEVKGGEVKVEALGGYGDGQLTSQMDLALYEGGDSMKTDLKAYSSPKNPASSLGSQKPAFVPSVVHRQMMKKVERRDVKVQAGCATRLICGGTQTEGPSYMDVAVQARVEMADKTTHTANNPQFASAAKSRQPTKRLTHRGMQAIVSTQDQSTEAKLSLIAPPEITQSIRPPLHPPTFPGMPRGYRPLNIFARCQNRATQTVKAEMVSQWSSVSARHLGYVCDKLVQAGRGFGEPLRQQGTQTDGVVTVKTSRRAIGPAMHYHSATQTDGSGTTHFHKATQWPDVLYSMDQVREATATSEPTSIKFYTPPEASYNTSTCPVMYPTVSMYTAPSMSTVYQEDLLHVIAPPGGNSGSVGQPDTSQLVVSASVSSQDQAASLPTLSSPPAPSSEYEERQSLLEAAADVTYSSPSNTTTTLTDSSGQAGELLMTPSSSLASSSAPGVVVSAGMPCATFPTFSPQMPLAPAVEGGVAPLVYVPQPAAPSLAPGPSYQPVYMPPYGAAPLPYAARPPQYYWLWK